MDSVLKRDLKGPPFIRLPSLDYIKCTRLIRSTNSAVLVLNTCMGEKTTLWTEMDVLRSGILTNTCRFKIEKFFAGVRQVFKCMKILRSLDILNILSEAVKSALGLDGKMLIPSRQYLQYILVKIIGVSQLALQTIRYCEYSQMALWKRTFIGHHLEQLLTFTSFISRVWHSILHFDKESSSLNASFSKEIIINYITTRLIVEGIKLVLLHTLIIQLKQCYDSVYQLQKLATPASYTWLPNGVQLPTTFPIDVKELLRSSSRCIKRDASKLENDHGYQYDSDKGAGGSIWKEHGAAKAGYHYGTSIKRGLDVAANPPSKKRKEEKKKKSHRNSSKAFSSVGAKGNVGGQNTKNTNNTQAANRSQNWKESKNSGQQNAKGNGGNNKKQYNMNAAGNNKKNRNNKQRVPFIKTRSQTLAMQGNARANGGKSCSRK